MPSAKKNNRTGGASTKYHNARQPLPYGSGLVCPPSPLFTPLMPPSRQSGQPPHSAPRRAARRRFRLVPSGEGSARAERVLRPAEFRMARAHGDLFGAAPALGDRANIRSMEAILGEILDTLPLSSEQIAPGLLKEGWARAAGAFISAQAELVSIADGVATIRTAQPAVRYELERMRRRLCEALSGEFGENSVRKLRILYG